MQAVELRNATLAYTEFIWQRRGWMLWPAYRRKVVFQDVNWTVRAGRTVLLKGPNGSGKSTLLRAVGGLLRPIAGEVWRYGQQATGPLEATRRTEYVSDKTSGFYRVLTVEQNLKIRGLLNGWAGSLAQKRMQRFGFQKVYNIIGGMLLWKEEGLPFVPGLDGADKFSFCPVSILIAMFRKVKKYSHNLLSLISRQKNASASVGHES